MTILRYSKTKIEKDYDRVSKENYSCVDKIFLCIKSISIFKLPLGIFHYKSRSFTSSRSSIAINFIMMVTLLYLTLSMLKKVGKVGGENMMILSMHMAELGAQRHNLVIETNPLQMEIIVMMQNHTFNDPAETYCKRIKFSWEMTDCQFRHDDRYSERHDVKGIEIHYVPDEKNNDELVQFMLGNHTSKEILHQNIWIDQDLLDNIILAHTVLIQTNTFPSVLNPKEV